jgi:hypothetical protein
MLRREKLDDAAFLQDVWRLYLYRAPEQARLLRAYRFCRKLAFARLHHAVAGVNYELPSTTITSPHPGS